VAGIAILLIMKWGEVSWPEKRQLFYTSFAGSQRQLIELSPGKLKGNEKLKKDAQSQQCSGRCLRPSADSLVHGL